jgi:5'-3' exoribonuclease 1
VKYIDDIVHLIKPRQLLFLAVDGVAPRAKMNQQRSRRFRTAKERKEMKDMAMEGMKEEDSELQLFDTNAISPGTEFMFELNKKLDYFVQYKINNDPLYTNIVSHI